MGSLLVICVAAILGYVLARHTLKTLTDGLNSDDVGGLLPLRDEKRFVVFDDEKIVGSAIWATRSSVAYIWGFYVRRDYQREGIGSVMMQVILDQKLVAPFLEVTVLQASGDAVAFYLSKGFSAMSEETYEMVPGQEHQAIVMRASQGKHRRD